MNLVNRVNHSVRRLAAPNFFFFFFPPLKFTSFKLEMFSVTSTFPSRSDVHTHTHLVRTFTVGLNYRTENNNGATLIMGRADLSLVERENLNSKRCEREKKKVVIGGGGLYWRLKWSVFPRCVREKKKNKKVSGCSSVLNDAAKKQKKKSRKGRESWNRKFGTARRASPNWFCR